MIKRPHVTEVRRPVEAEIGPHHHLATKAAAEEAERQEHEAARRAGHAAPDRPGGRHA